MQRWMRDFARAFRPTTRAGLSALLLVLPLVGSGLGACGGSGDEPPDPPATPADAAADVHGDVTVDTNDAEAPDAGNEAAPDSGGDAGECVPKTCSTLGANCGSAPDGCGGKIECGACPNGQTCGGGGANSCGTDSCAPKGCVQADASCGYASDGCSKAIDCGGCPPPTTCGGSGQHNQCGCSPRSCAQLDANCGTLPDGCTGVVDCGVCPSGQTCGGGGPNQCGVDTCTAKTCSQVNASCGFVSDGCNVALDCGQCSPPDECGGSGVANQCGCTPKTCSQLGVSCGPVDNGCEVVNCGDCAAPDTCGGGEVKGQCGCQCTLPHAQTNCLQGECSINTCDPGWGDCNGSAGDGCETDIHNEVNHCGGCGQACDTNNADCDAPDTCDGAGHCVAQFKLNGVLCRTGKEASCDPPEACTGSSAVCPPDTFAGNGTACGSPNNTGCDAPDSCNGAGSCVARFKPSSAICRAAGANATCDPAEHCPGSSVVCPGDAVASQGTPCPPGSSCNGAGTCCDANMGTSCVYYGLEEAWACTQFQPWWCDQPGQSLYSYDYCGPDEAYCGPSPNEKCFVQCLHAYDGWVNCDGVCGP